MKERKEQFPHLVIPEGDIERVAKKPTGRTIAVPRNHIEHGQLLLEGFKVISKSHSENLSSLGEDVVVFKVQLEKNHKFQDKKRQEFLNRNKININALRNNQTAIVSTEKAELNKFKNKIENYTKYSQNREFQYIDEISVDDTFDKQSIQIKELLSEETLPIEKIDIQLMLIPGLSKKLYEAALSELRKKIESVDGEFIRDPYYLSDGTPIIRVKILPSEINYICSDEAIYRIEKTNFFEFSPSHIKLNNLSGLKLNENVDTDRLLPVVVIDSGVDFSKFDILAPLFQERFIAAGAKVIDPSHGTAVASRVLFGDEIDTQVKMGELDMLRNKIKNRQKYCYD